MLVPIDVPARGTTPTCSMRPTNGRRRPVAGVRGSGGVRPWPQAQRPPVSLPAARPAYSPQWKPSEAVRVYLGEQRSRSPAALEPNPKLEAALERWRRVAEQAGGMTGGA